MEGGRCRSRGALFLLLVFPCASLAVQFQRKELDVQEEGNLQAPRPNIVWLMADDLGYGELGLNYRGDESRRIDTPNLDQLATEGILFQQAYSGYTVCAPSRTTFFTGRHSGSFWKHGLDGENISPREGERTLAVLLKKAGYTTGAFGKISPLTDPLKTGFDRFVGQIDQNLCHNMYPRYIDEGYGKLNHWIGNEYEKNRPSRESCLQEPERFNYTIDVFQKAGIAWLKDVVATSEKPFFLYLAYTVPHAGGWNDVPLDSTQGQPVPDLFRYKETDWPDVERDHAAAVTYLDMKVGYVMKTLKTLGVDDNTLVFFASDNGAHVEGGHSGEFFFSSGGLRGQKRSLFEGGVRTPTIARWPARIQPGRTSNFAWAFWDVLPTITELAGVETPPGLDGISIVPTLYGETQADKEYLFFSWRTRQISEGVPDDGPTVLLSIDRRVKTKKKGKWSWASLLSSGRHTANSTSVQKADVPPPAKRHAKMRWREARRHMVMDKVNHNVAAARAREVSRGENVMAYAVRQGRWKGVVPVCEDFTPRREDEMELYDLFEDPFEENDVASQNPSIVKDLKQLVVSKELSCSCFQCDWPAP